MPVGAAVVISPLMLTYIRSSELSSAFGAALCNLFSPFSGEREQLGRGGTVGCENHELSVLLSPDLSCLGHAVIKLSERLLHDSDPVIGVGQLLLELQSRIHMTRNRLRERLRVIFRLVEIPQAARFLAVVFTLLRLQQNHHILDHGDDLGEINALPAERQSNQLVATLRMAEPTRLWRKLLPDTPFSRAAMAMVSASMLAARSELSASDTEAPLSSRAWLLRATLGTL